MAQNGSQISRLQMGVTEENFSGSRTRDQMVAGEEYQNATKTPEYMVKIDGLLNSTTQGFEEYALLYHFEVHLSRQTNPNAPQEKKDSGRLVMQNPVLVIESGNFTAPIVQQLVNGKNIEEIKIARLGNIGGELNQTIEEYNFTNCEFQDVRTSYDTIRVEFRATTVEIVIHTFDQTGVNQGQSNVKFDLKTGQLQ